jgi:hypothetical protein
LRHQVAAAAAAATFQLFELQCALLLDLIRLSNANSGKEPIQILIEISPEKYATQKELREKICAGIKSFLSDDMLGFLLHKQIGSPQGFFPFSKNIKKVEMGQRKNFGRIIHQRAKILLASIIIIIIYCVRVCVHIG